ncbi:metal-dependent hydrolase [Planctomycetales bacterium ZRK34]|nr:metal-dependent hydrolase [Planctomycetales bacterium ZRK34]
MYFIDPHIHCVSRTTEDYERLAMSGVVAVSEPAFWAGFDRSSSDSFVDYFRQLTDFEPKRAAQFGIDHYTWICINAKEAENVSLSREVIARMPEFMDMPNVLGVGEIGLNKNTKNECTIFMEQAEFAIKNGHLILVHTPHLFDKLKGTVMTLDMLRELGADPDRVIIDHTEEHTLKMVLDAGYWAGMTLYPISKMTPARAADMLETYGSERICVNAAADWGVSDPFNLHRCCMDYRARGHAEQELVDIFHNNPVGFFSQCPRFKVKPLTVDAPEHTAV